MLVSPYPFHLILTLIHTGLTAGLNNPPLTLKNTQTLTIKLNPNIKLMYSNTLVFGACVMLFPVCPDVATSLYIAAVFATLVPPNAKKRNMNVPANSAAAATSSLRQRLGKKPRLVGRPGGFPVLGRVLGSCWEDVDASFLCKGRMFLSAMVGGFRVKVHLERGRLTEDPNITSSIKR
jgi:hypothetical protein